MRRQSERRRRRRQSRKRRQSSRRNKRNSDDNDDRDDSGLKEEKYDYNTRDDYHDEWEQRDFSGMIFKNLKNFIIIFLIIGFVVVLYFIVSAVKLQYNTAYMHSAKNRRSGKFQLEEGLCRFPEKHAYVKHNADFGANCKDAWTAIHKNPMDYAFWSTIEYYKEKYFTFKIETLSDAIKVVGFLFVGCIGLLLGILCLCSVYCRITPRKIFRWGTSKFM